MHNSRIRNQTRITVERILDGAQKVLANEGYATFTMRLVAKTAGISLGTLTYHFTTKNELIKSLISRLLEGYLQQFENIFEIHEDPEKQVERLVYWVMKEIAVDEETVAIAREVWAMALHDEAIRDIVDDFYDELTENLVTVLGQFRPDLNGTAKWELVYLLVMLSEGTVVLYGTRRERTLSVDHMIKTASQILGNMT
jgi:AcrR family transcriptional regulator